MFTANCCFKLVFVATKVAHRAMTDMLSKERERERLTMMRVSGKFDTSLGKIQRESEREKKKREETRKNESRTREEKKSLSVEDARRSARRVVVVAGDVKRKKDTQKRINL